MGSQKHDTFSKAFREEAVRQALESRRPLTTLARDLGVKYSTLRLWVKQAGEPDADQPERGRGHVAAQHGQGGPVEPLGHLRRGRERLAAGQHPVVGALELERDDAADEGPVLEPRRDGLRQVP